MLGATLQAEPLQGQLEPLAIRAVADVEQKGGRLARIIAVRAEGEEPSDIAGRFAAMPRRHDVCAFECCVVVIAVEVQPRVVHCVVPGFAVGAAADEVAAPGLEQGKGQRAAQRFGCAADVIPEQAAEGLAVKRKRSRNG